MKLTSITLAAAVSLVAWKIQPSESFVPSSSGHFGVLSSSTTTTQSSPTELSISSWGARGPPSRWKEEEADPESKIQSYLKAPEPVMAREGLDGSVLVSGWVNTKERTDQTIFDFLNNEESAFAFDKIIAFVDDAKFAKKRLISRSARYTGLLDKLDFIQAEAPASLPTLQQLNDASVKHWVVNANTFATGGDILGTVKAIASLASDCSTLQNVAILITDAQTIDNSPNALSAAIESFSQDVKFTIVAVGAITETPEGKIPYGITDVVNVDATADTLLPSNATYSRDESLRLVAECLGLSCAEDKAMVFEEITNVNATAFKLVKGLREGGYTRPQEIDHMISKGPEEYQKAIDDFKTRSPARTSHDAWLEEKQRELDESAAERKARVKQEYEDRKKEEIENIAREWAKREYFRKATSGDMPYSEEEYIKSVWERAMFEGDLKYRMLHGQETDERKELAEFKKKQEKKKAMMLERAKASLDELLDEDDDDDDME